VTSLKPFHAIDKTNIVEIAAKDKRMQMVKAIHKHRKVGKSDRNTKFHVEWEDGDFTWEPYANLRINSILHEYLRTHKMRALIPAAFK
jgi:hypothetical protein